MKTMRMTRTVMSGIRIGQGVSDSNASWMVSPRCTPQKMLLAKPAYVHPAVISPCGRHARDAAPEFTPQRSTCEIDYQQDQVHIAVGELRAQIKMAEHDGFVRFEDLVVDDRVSAGVGVARKRSRAC